MPALTTDCYLAQIEASTAAIAGLVDGGDLTMPIPTCPDWTLRQLATHLGRAHRWAAQITRTRSPQFIPFQSVPDGRIPDDPAEHATWLTAGARGIVTAVREAGEDPVWALGEQRPASFWGRRMCHETVVHETDVRLAIGKQPDIAAPLAADAVDEWLTVLGVLLYDQHDPRVTALPEGSALQVRVTDDGLDGPTAWLISHRPGGVTVVPVPAAGQDASGADHDAGQDTADATLAGPAERLLLVLTRRAPADDDGVTVLGDGALVTSWLDHTPF